jgi:hypothetical protein
MSTIELHTSPSQSFDFENECKLLRIKLDSNEKWLKIMFTIMSVLAGTCLGLSITSIINSNKNTSDINTLNSIAGLSSGTIPFSRISQVEINNGMIIAGTITGDKLSSGTITSDKISTIQAPQITGLITSTQINSIGSNQVTGLINANQINTISTSQLTGTINSGMITSVQSTSILGQLTSNQILTIQSNQISGLILSSQIQSVTASSIIGLIQNNQINSLMASQISGQLLSTQIQTINSNQINGLIQSSQINSITPGQIVGQLSSNQITNINSNQISGIINTNQLPFVGPLIALVACYTRQSQTGVYWGFNCNIQNYLNILGGSLWSVEGSYYLSSASFSQLTVGLYGNDGMNTITEPTPKINSMFTSSTTSNNLILIDLPNMYPQSSSIGSIPFHIISVNQPTYYVPNVKFSDTLVPLNMTFKITRLN